MCHDRGCRQTSGIHIQLICKYRLGPGVLNAPGALKICRNVGGFQAAALAPSCQAAAKGDGSAQEVIHQLQHSTLGCPCQAVAWSHCPRQQLLQALLPHHTEGHSCKSVWQSAWPETSPAASQMKVLTDFSRHKQPTEAWAISCPSQASLRGLCPAQQILPAPVSTSLGIMRPSHGKAAWQLLPVCSGPISAHQMQAPHLRPPRLCNHMAERMLGILGSICRRDTAHGNSHA